MHMKRWFSAFVLVLMVIGLPLVVSAADKLAGHWKGEISLPGTALEVMVRFSKAPDGQWRGDISIPLQKAKDIPLTGFMIKGESVRFSISGIPGDPTFQGNLDQEGTTIQGTFTQGGQEFPFKLNRADDPDSLARAALEKFDEVINQGLKSLKVPGVAMAVVRNDKVLFAGGFGKRDLERDLPMTADTLLAIGSSSKAFTTFALGVLVDRGEMEWDKPVRNYIPWFRMHDPVVSDRLTPRDMVTHRSGLPRHDLVWYNNFTASREELVRRIKYLKLSADLRQKFQYNNLMFLSAGFLLEKLTGSPWEEAVRDLVFRPLGMKRSNFSVEDSRKDENFAQPYRVDGEGNPEKIPFRDITTVGPAGSINSSVNEMSRWLMTHLYDGKYDGKQIINAATLQDMHSPHMTGAGTSTDPRISAADYGMGWFVDHYRGQQRVHHGGNIDGFSCMVSMLPEKGLGFVAIANKNHAALPELLIRTAADRLLGLEPVDWIADAAKRVEERNAETKKAAQKKVSRRIAKTRLSHPLRHYPGIYRHPGYGDLVVGHRGKALQFSFNGIVTALEHWHYDTFSGTKIEDPTFEDMKLTFYTDVNGFVSSVSAPFEAMTGPVVFKKQPDPRFRDSKYLATLTGAYSLTGRKVKVELKGDVLTLRTAGQPASELVPDLGGEFYLKEVEMIRLKFTADKSGKVTGFEVYQPQGVFTAQRIKEQ